jgi:hypothetical protein
MPQEISVELPDETFEQIQRWAAHDALTVPEWLARAAERESLRAMFTEHARVMREIGEPEAALWARHRAGEAERAEWRSRTDAP